MRTSWWMAGALASAIGVGGCARDVREDPQKLGRVPFSEKEQIFAAEHNVEVALANQAASKREREVVAAFRQNAKADLDSASAQVKSAQRSVQLAREGRDENRLRSANQFYEFASRQRAAAEAKQRYARQLKELRDTEEELAGQELELAQMELGLTRARALLRGGMTPEQNVEKLTDRRKELLSRVLERRQKVSALRADTQALAAAWQAQQESYRVAARDLEASIGTRIQRPLVGERIEPRPLDFGVPGERPGERQPVSGRDEALPDEGQQAPDEEPIEQEDLRQAPDQP